MSQDNQQAQTKITTKDEEDLKLHLLGLTKEILHYKASMKWEINKEAEDISVEAIINGAEKMYKFLKEEK
jgi:hypothetical protein